MPDLADLTPTFSSNFSNFVSSPNGSVGWQTTLPHGARTLATNSELEYYSDPSVGYDPFSVQNGILDITAQPESNPAGLPYDSGIITTEGSFSQLYGYFDMRAELPAGAGTWPAFWMLPANLASTREIDVMEMFGSNPLQYRVTDHSPDSGLATTNVATPDLSQGFHDYGVYWTPTSLSFYFDGHLVANMPTPADMNVPMFMLANLAVASNVSAATQFPAHMLIQSITAYAYNPNDPGSTPQLYVSYPTQVSGATGQSIPLGTVSIVDTDSSGTGSVTVDINDKSLGLFTTNPTAGVTTTGENSWNLQLTGALPAVNAALATLTYENIPTTSTAPTQDTVTVSAADTDGNMDAERIAVSLTPGPKLSFISVTPAATRYASSGSDVFVFDNGGIANTTTNGGQADHLIDFHSESQNPAGWDFLALHGFDPTATLVFDHYADVNGVPNDSMQYYHVASSAGNSPIFLVQMANNSTAHLAPHDYGFYPT
jgi:beta-glucanase (GH16 family)